jgi:hypothetical protein
MRKLPRMETSTLSPKVLLAVPCFDHVYSDFCFALARMAALPRDSFKLELMDCRTSDIVGARNMAVETALNRGSTHLLFIDSDMEFPPDVVSRLLGHGKAIVGGSYVRRSTPFEMLGELSEPFTVSKPLIEAIALPTGCLLINTMALKKLPWPWFRFEYENETRIGEDIYFSREARKAGLKLWLDTKLTTELKHIGIKKYS